MWPGWGWLPQVFEAGSVSWELFSGLWILFLVFG